jgi:UDP-galactopyranose mutase
MKNTTISPPAADLLCLSHLRWKFVFQRPQHLMSRFARERRVFFFEEPVFSDADSHIELEVCPDTGVRIAVPVLKDGISSDEIERETRSLLDSLIADQSISDGHLLWYYTPMAIPFSSHLRPAATIFDCMDELSAFKEAPLALKQNEAELFRRADVVFTGGHSLYESKKKQHHNVHAFPSSVDVEHFRRARTHDADPDDQAPIPHPRIGYVGVIDERMDLELLAQCARLRPDWHFVMVGPVVKISLDSLPKASNIHYLGGKSYGELPAYLAGWDVAMLPFARNESTKFISPTKTPEYLAAGRPVVSTSIRDVVRPYGEAGMVRIADTPDAFVDAIEGLLADSGREWLVQADDFLKTMSWNRTWEAMNRLIEQAVIGNKLAGAERSMPLMTNLNGGVEACTTI